MKSILAHFPVTHSLFQVAEGVSEEVNSSTGNSVYLNIPIWLALAPFFMLALIPTLLSDSMFQLYEIFGLSWSNIMSVINYIRNETPEGIKKIAITVGLAIGSIALLNVISGSVYAVFFALKAAIVLAAITHVGLVIKENIPNMMGFAELVRERTSEFLDRRRTNISNFFKVFTFRIKKETGVPVVSGDEPAAPVEYVYFPYMPSGADICESITPGFVRNPFAGMFSRSTAQAAPLSGMASSNELETEPESPASNGSPKVSPIV